MQETKKHTRASFCTRSCPDKGTEPVRYKEWSYSTPEKTPTSFPNTGNDYLKEVFKNILASEVGCNLSELIAQGAKDSIYLYDSVANYFKLMGKSLQVAPSGCFELDAFNLYYALREILPETQGINFDVWGGKLSIILFDEDIKFPEYILFYIPVCGTENMNEQLREAFLQFLSFVRKTQKIDIPCENRYFDYVVSEYGEEYEECMEEEDNWIELTDMRKRYDSGDVNSIMEYISKTYIDELDIESKLCKLLAEDISPVDKGMVLIMIEGLKLLRQDCIFNYDYCPDTGNYINYNSEFIEFNRSFCFCWGNESNDPVVNMVIEFYNNEQQELSTYGPTAYMELTPATDQLFERSDFPTRFGKWYNEFYKELENYMSNGTKNE